MRQRIPEDLSGLPDVPVNGDAAESVEAVGPVPEDLSGLPDAPLEVEAPESAPAGARVRARSVVAMLLVLSLAGLAALLAATELGRLISASHQIHPILGWTSAGLVGLVVCLLGIIGVREVRGYLRLGSFVSLRSAFQRLEADPMDPAIRRRAQRETEEFLDYLEKHSDSGVALRIERLRGRLDVAEDAEEWREDIERVLLGPLDEEVREVIQREAVNVGIGTAISPSGFVDAAIASWRNLRLIRRIASIYRVRAGACGTYLILRRTIAAAALADLAQEASVALLGTTRSLGSVIGAPLTQGLANAGLTIRVGLKAQEQCRPLAMPEERRRGTLRLLMGSAASMVRRVSRSKQRNAAAADEEANEAE